MRLFSQTVSRWRGQCRLPPVMSAILPSSLAIYFPSIVFFPVRRQRSPRSLSADAVATRRKDAIGIEGTLDGGAYLGKSSHPRHRLFLKIERRARDRIPRLAVGRRQCSVAGDDALTLLWGLAVKKDEVQCAAHARAAHVFRDEFQPVLAQNAA